MTTRPTYEDQKQRVKELQKAVADLGKPEENYRSMIEYTNDIIAITTFSLKPMYTYISPSVKKIMGYEPEERLRFYHGQAIRHWGISKRQRRSTVRRCCKEKSASPHASTPQHKWVYSE